MAKNQVVLAVFSDEAAADAAVVSLKAWDKASDEVKLTSIGVLVLDDKGELKTHKMGSRSKAKGAGIGLVLAIVALPIAAAGLVGGAAIGAFHHKGLGMTAEDKASIGAQLAEGKAAVGVLANDEEAGAIVGKLAELGGDVTSHEVTDEALEAVAEAAPEAEAEHPQPTHPRRPEPPQAPRTVVRPDPHRAPRPVTARGALALPARASTRSARSRSTASWQA